MLRVVTYNIQDGGHGRLHSIAAVLRALQPDAVALLEANSKANVEWLAQELGLDFVLGRANNPFHIAWLTCRPILSYQNHQHHMLEKTLLELELDWAGHPLQLYATHLAPHQRQEREIRRLLEIEAVLAIIRHRPDHPRILVGDFNSMNPSTPITRILDEGYIDCYQTLHPGHHGFTHPANSPTRRIDFIFSTTSLGTRLRTCQPHSSPDVTLASDHCPVWADFE